MPAEEQEGSITVAQPMDLLDEYVKTRKEKFTLTNQLNISIFEFPSHALPNVEGEQEERGSLKSGVGIVVDTISQNSSLFAKGLTCHTCHKTFSCRDEQIEHFKGELHPINLKRSLLKLPALANEADLRTHRGDVTLGDDEDVEEDELNEEMEGADEVEDDEANADTLEEFEAHELEGSMSSPIHTSAGTIKKQFSQDSGPMFVYHPTHSRWQLAISVTAISHVEGDESEFAAGDDDPLANNRPWKILHFTMYKAVSNTLWCVMLLRSGKFAITIFEKNTPVLHRVKKHYTVRAKAGGSQASYDNKGSNAKSMGANLRRRGEAKLKEDIKKVLDEWKSQIQSCSILLVSIPKTMKSHIFLDEGVKETYLYRTDPRVRSIPFITDKPSFEETKRVHELCSTVRLTRYNGDVPVPPAGAGSSGNVISSADQDANLFAPTSKKPPSLPLPLASTTSLNVLPETIDVCKACEEGDTERLQSLLQKLKIDDMLSSVSFPHNMEDFKTALHIASEKGNTEMVKHLLMNGGDPSRMDSRSKTPYAVAKDKDTRDMFRRCRGYEKMEEMWNWDSCGVPAAITEEFEKAQREREKEKKRRAKQKKKENKEKDEREAIEAKRMEELEQIEAEQRKLETIKNAGECAACQISLYGKKVLDVLDKKCCSGPCVIRCRRQLQAQAAERRFGVIK